MHDEKKTKYDQQILLCIHSYIDAAELEKIKKLLMNFELLVVNAVEFPVSRNMLLSYPIEKNKAFAVIHYGLQYDYHNYSKFDFYIESANDINSLFLGKLAKFMEVRNRKVMLYLSKFPRGSEDVDGGSQTAGQLIDTLKNRCTLNVIFVRKNGETFFDDNINEISYKEHINPFGNKFIRRLDNIETNRSAIMDKSDYDLIIGMHCSKFFGLHKEKNIMKKAIIFPMMLTPGYLRSKEEVPKEYTEMEREVLKNVYKIITPSVEEQKDILNEYGKVLEKKIKIIPRGVSPLIKGRVHNLKKNGLNLITIGSFKLQKNHMATLKVFMMLKEMGIPSVFLTIIGSIHDRRIYNKIISFIKNNNLSDVVKIYSGINNQQLVEILDKMDINLSCSKWETFGRGIFEGICSGLPTILLDNLKVIKKYAQGNEGVYFLKTISQMAQCIYNFYKTPELYRSASKNVLKIAELVSYFTERERLLCEVLYKSFHVESEYFDWNFSECKLIYNGTYSFCYKKNNFVRKYFNFVDIDKIKTEFQLHKLAYNNHILTSKPQFISYDIENCKWYIQSIYLKCTPLKIKFLDIYTYNRISAFISQFQNIPIQNVRKFNFLFDDIFKTLDCYSDYYNKETKYEKELLLHLDNSTFVHGDFLIKNLNLLNNKIAIFDFENACKGPAEWDICYFLSEFNARSVSKTVKNKITYEKISIIIAILKIRIGRAIRKGKSDRKLKKILSSWEDLIND